MKIMKPIALMFRVRASPQDMVVQNLKIYQSQAATGISNLLTPWTEFWLRYVLRLKEDLNGQELAYLMMMIQISWQTMMKTRLGFQILPLFGLVPD